MGDGVTIQTDGLDKLLKALKTRPPKARVGILGSSARSGKSQSTNAQVGAAHEFGTSKLPVRSFLRVPLTDRLNKEIRNAGLLNKDVLNNVIKSGSVRPWLEKVTLIAEKIVIGAFGSSGYGRWPGWKGSYQSKTGEILVDSQQLRNSITSEVSG